MICIRSLSHAKSDRLCNSCLIASYFGPIIIGTLCFNDIRSKEDSVLWDVFAASGPAELGGREDNIGNKNKRFNDLL